MKRIKHTIQVGDVRITRFLLRNTDIVKYIGDRILDRLPKGLYKIKVESFYTKHPEHFAYSAIV